jgi:hypothetical protein
MDKVPEAKLLFFCEWLLNELDMNCEHGKYELFW